MADSDLREAYSAANAQEAHCIKAMLNEAGIEARVVGELLQNAVGDFSAGAISPRVWVRSNDFDRARQIISHQHSRQRAANTTLTEWACPECGEPNEPTFEICWNCQAARTTKE